jgi:precorrin isomerase
MLMIDYLRDGDAIYRKSFDIIRAETNLSELPLDLESVAVRLMHACGMTDIVHDLAYSVDAAQVGRTALRAGASILCDAQMVAYGIIQKRLPAGNSVICTLQEPSVSEIAQKIQNTRSAAAIELWRSHLEGAVVAIGNAPTALFHLLEMIQEGVPKPAWLQTLPLLLNWGNTLRRCELCWRSWTSCPEPFILSELPCRISRFIRSTKQTRQPFLTGR